jgi:hypothetical protein
MSPYQHSLHSFVFAVGQQEKDVTGKGQEQVWLQGICEVVVLVVVVFVVVLWLLLWLS